VAILLLTILIAVLFYTILRIPDLPPPPQLAPELDEIVLLFRIKPVLQDPPRSPEGIELFPCL
jgi:hypothetical protein